MEKAAKLKKHGSTKKLIDIGAGERIRVGGFAGDQRAVLTIEVDSVSQPRSNSTLVTVCGTDEKTNKLTHFETSGLAIATWDADEEVWRL